MLALYRAGRQSEALQGYHDARRSLVEELGIEPSPALRQLYRWMLQQKAGLERAPPPRPVEDHFGDVVKALLSGRLVPILGVGVNQPDDSLGNGLPGPAEVAEQLARSFDCPPEHARDLAHVAEYVAMTRGVGPLYDALHALFDRDCAPGRCIGRWRSWRACCGRSGSAPQLIITTNFDQLLEQAFTDAGEECDVVSYLTLGRDHGKFLHVPPERCRETGRDPQHLCRPLARAAHGNPQVQGGVDRGAGREWESFVVSEDDHIDYLAQADITVIVPVTLAASCAVAISSSSDTRSTSGVCGCSSTASGAARELATNHGRSARRRTRSSSRLWRQRGIDTIDLPLEEYLEALRGRVEAEVGT